MKNNDLTPFKWMGGKRWAKSLIQPLWEDYQKNSFLSYWVDVCCGAGGLPLNLDPIPHFAILCDQSQALIDFWNAVSLGKYIHQGYLDEETYYFRRKQYNEGDRTLFHQLVSNCHGGRYRVNKSGKFNAPWDKTPGRKVPKRDFTALKEVTSSWQFRNQGYNTTLTSGDIPEDGLFFFDPPYWGVETSYTDLPFTWDDQVQAAYLLGQKEFAIAFNTCCDAIAQLYTEQGFDVFAVPKSHSIGAGKKGSAKKELLAVKGLDVKTLEDFKYEATRELNYA